MPESLSKEEQAKLEKLGYAVDMLEDDGKKIQAYDFKTPKRFTKDNIRLLNTIYDCFAKTFANRLTGVLRTAIQVDVVSVEEMTYSEFSRGKGKGYILPLIETKLREDENYSTGHFVIALPVKTMCIVLNKLLGGGGDEVVESGRKFTPLELNLIRNFVAANVTTIIETAWANYIDLLTNTEDILLIPEANRKILPAAQMLNVGFEMVIDKVAQEFSICMPVDLVEGIFRSLGNRFMGLEDAEKADQKKSLMLGHIKDSEVEIGVVLGKTELDLGDVLSLHSGDVIMLDSFTDSPVKVMVKGKEWFWGKAGVCRGRKSVKLTEIL